MYDSHVGHGTTRDMSTSCLIFTHVKCDNKCDSVEIKRAALLSYEKKLFSYLKEQVMQVRTA